MDTHTRVMRTHKSWIHPHTSWIYIHESRNLTNQGHTQSKSEHVKIRQRRPVTDDILDEIYYFQSGGSQQCGIFAHKSWDPHKSLAPSRVMATHKSRTLTNHGPSPFQIMHSNNSKITDPYNSKSCTLTIPNHGPSQFQIMDKLLL